MPTCLTAELLTSTLVTEVVSEANAYETAQIEINPPIIIIVFLAFFFSLNSFTEEKIRANSKPEIDKNTPKRINGFM